MKTTIRLILALIFVGVISISAVLLSRKGVGGAQVDFTSGGLYTLSDGTKSILGKLNQTITLKLYYARVAAMKGPDQIRFWNNYYLYVRDLLEEYTRLSGGKIKLELIDPRTYSADEEEAIRNGIKRFPISDDESFYFGMLATTELGKDDVIEFFEPNRQELVEYDVSKIISSLMQRKKRKIGIVSSLPVMGPANMSPYMMQMMRMQGRQPDPPWTITRQMQIDYEVQSLKLDTHEVPDDIDFLMVIHPKNLDQKARFAIDQFVMKGGKLMVFVDPHCLADRPPRDPRNPYAGLSHHAGSDLNNLLINWGVVVATKKIAVDRAVATKTGRPPQAFLPYLTLNSECVNASEAMVAKINDVRMLFAGAISRHGGYSTFRPLLSTTKTGSTWLPKDATSLNMPDAQKIQKEVRDGTEPVVLACLLTGKFTTNFPTGIEVERDGADDETPDTQPATTRPATTQPATTQPATTQPKDKTKRIEPVKESAEGAMVLVVSDVDILTDMLCYDRSFFGMAQSGSNVPFVLNALEFLSGSKDLISIRSRGRFSRPFTVVDEIERETDRQTQEEIDAVNAKIKGYQSELDALGKKSGSEQDAAVLQEAVLAKRRQIEADITAANRQLRDLKSIRREKVEALEFKLKIYNIAAASAILLLIAILLWLFRYFRAKHYAAQRA
ncbi:MAG: GldG family protein [Phycisphaerae bacterium]|nr:GldG family protein [Phycisphaerae bacterium]